MIWGLSPNFIPLTCKYELVWQKILTKPNKGFMSFANRCILFVFTCYTMSQLLWNWGFTFRSNSVKFWSKTSVCVLKVLISRRLTTESGLSVMKVQRVLWMFPGEIWRRSEHTFTNNPSSDELSQHLPHRNVFADRWSRLRGGSSVRTLWNHSPSPGQNSTSSGLLQENADKQGQKLFILICRLTKWFTPACVKECAKDKVCYESWPRAAEEQWQRMLGAGSDACRELLTLQKKTESLALPPSPSPHWCIKTSGKHETPLHFCAFLFFFLVVKQSRIAGIKAAQLSCV